MLRSLYEKITDGYLTVITLRPHYTMKPFHVSELAEFSAYMLELSDQWDVYHNYNVMGAMPSGGRGKASDFNACAGTFLDFDLWQPDGKAHAANDKLPNNLNQVCDLLKEEDLPLPTYFVNSGNGAHGHFVFEEPETFATDVERALVQTQRKAFEQVYIDAFKKVGWKLDPMSDLPRITRAAGTKNHKTNPPKPVTLLAEYGTGIALSRSSYLDVVKRARLNSSPPRSVTVQSAPTRPEAQGTPTKVGNPQAIFAGCRWANGIVARGDRLTYNEWFAFAGLTKHLDNGEKIFHDVSRNDVNYEEGLAAKTFAGAHGPITCEHVKEVLASDDCLGCPFPFTSLRTPNALGDLSPHLAMLMSRNVYSTNRQMFIDTGTRKAHPQKYMNERYGKHVGPAASSQLIMDRRMLQTDDTWYDAGNPSFLANRHGKTAVNTWLPSQLIPVEGDASVILEHFDYLLPVEAERSHFLSALAHAIQHPSEKIKHVLFVIGGQGTGKSWLGSLVRSLFGAHNVCVVDNSLFTSTFNAPMGDKQVLLMEEVGLEDRAEAYQMLKMWVTEESIRVNEKHVPTYDASTPKLIIAMSNKEVPLKIEGDDRRLFFVKSPKVPREQIYYDRLFEEGLAQASAFLHILLARNIDTFSASARPPMTEVKKSVIAASQPAVLQELQAMVDGGEWPFCEELFKLEDAERQVSTRISGRADRSRATTLAALKSLGFCRTGADQTRLIGEGRVRLWARDGSRWIGAPAEELREQFLKQQLVRV